MNEDELNKRLEALTPRRTINDICALVHIHTDVIIDPKHVKNALMRGALSKPYTALFCMVLNNLEGATSGSV